MGVVSRRKLRRRVELRNILGVLNFRWRKVRYVTRGDVSLIEAFT